MIVRYGAIGKTLLETNFAISNQVFSGHML